MLLVLLLAYSAAAAAATAVVIIFIVAYLYIFNNLCVCTFSHSLLLVFWFLVCHLPFIVRRSSSFYALHKDIAVATQPR